jgi:peptidoglycan-associated lipoprotein
MRIRIEAICNSLLVIAVISCLTAASSAQSAKLAKNPVSPEVSVTYTYAHSNAPPGGCGCFSLNGGGASIAIPFGNSPWQFVGDVTLTHAANISPASYDLNLSTCTVGARYRPKLRSGSWQPFAQVLAGPAYSSGTLLLAQNQSGANGHDAFAASIGGGVDLRVNRRFSFRLADASYLLTTFNNGTNNHQNNLRVSTGVVVRF